MKPHNLLVDKQRGVVKIADLGLRRAFTIPIKKYTHEVSAITTFSTFATGFCRNFVLADFRDGFVLVSW